MNDIEKNNDESFTNEYNKSEESTSLNILEIKKKNSKLVSIDYRLYQKLIVFINKSNSALHKIKERKYNILKHSQKTQTEDIIDTIFKSKLEEIKLNQIKNEEIIMSLKSENQKIKEKLKQLEIKLSEKEIKYKDLVQKYLEEITNKQKIIEELTHQLIILKEENKENKKKISNMIYYPLSEKVLNNEKLFSLILSFLPNEFYFRVICLNKRINFYLSYKIKYHLIKKKLFQNQKLINELINSSDISQKYQIEEEELIKILNKYTRPHEVPGNSMRYSLFRSLIFIDNMIKKPLQEKYDKMIHSSSWNKKNKIFDEAKLIFKDIFKIVKNEESNEITQIIKAQKIPEELREKIISFYPDNYSNLNNYDNKILKFMNEDKYINIKFEFKSSNDIKILINHFLTNGLEKSYYRKFHEYLIDDYTELFFNCYKSLSSIRELEIANLALNARYKRNEYFMKEMNLELENLKRYAETSQYIKEKLLKEKNDLEIKYNHSLIEISTLKKKIINDKELIERLINEKNMALNDFTKKKEKIILEYKNFEEDYNKLKKEKQYFINTILDLQNFINNVFSFEENK